MTNWPTHPDGSNKRVGDMTPEERRAVIAESNARVMQDWWSPVPSAVPEPVAPPIDFWQPD